MDLQALIRDHVARLDTTERWLDMVGSERPPDGRSRHLRLPPPVFGPLAARVRRGDTARAWLSERRHKIEGTAVTIWEFLYPDVRQE